MSALALLLLASAHAAAPATEAQIVQLDKARAQISDQLHLVALDLVDELVYGWTVQPPFTEPTALVVADVTVPFGLNAGLTAQVENHLAALLSHHPTTNVQLVHCPRCTAVIVHSGPEGTIVSRGVDNPSALAELGEDSGRHALFLDIEAQGSSLVLRARVTRLTPDLPIVYSHTLSSDTTKGALLRQGTSLKSAEDARAEYLATLRDRGPTTGLLRTGLRTYARPTGGDQGAIAPPPFLWVQGGLEIGANDARAWTGSVVLGASFVPQAYQGLMAQGRVSRLITGRARSLVRPDLYLFGGATIQTVWGPAIVPFLEQPPDADDVLVALLGQAPREVFGTLHVGLEARFGNRVGVTVFLENLPTFTNNPNMGRHVRTFGIPWQVFGAEVGFYL